MLQSLLIDQIIDQSESVLMSGRVTKSFWFYVANIWTRLCGLLSSAGAAHA